MNAHIFPWQEITGCFVAQKQSVTIFFLNSCHSPHQLSLNWQEITCFADGLTSH